MSGPAELSIAAGVLADAGLKATAVLGLAGAATLALRQASAAQRHAIWAAAFAALPALPLVAVQRGPEIALDLPWLVAIWAAGVAVALIPLVRGLLGLQGLRSEGRPDPSAPGLFHSDHIHGPLTWGLFRPVILLPSAATDWPANHREAALAHERAHIARRDWAVHLAVWFVCALFWFHPLAWLARRQLALEAEHAADDAVIAQGFAPSDYAELLVSLACRTTPQGALGVGPSLVGSRVHAVLGPRSRSTRRWPAWVLAAGLAALTLPALGAWPTWSAPEEALTCSPATGGQLP